MTTVTTSDAEPREDAYAVTVDTGMRVRDGSWDGEKARRQLFNWATEGDVTDLAKAARGFVVADLDPPGEDDPTRGDLKLPVAYVEDGELVGIGNGIRNALSRLPQTQGLSDAVRAEAKSALESMLARLNEQDASALLTAPALAMDVEGGRVFRWSRISLDLSPRQLAVVDRAIELAKVGHADSASLQSVAKTLRSDGYDEYLTAEGFLRLEVLAARTGTQLYSDGTTTWGEYRSADEVGSEKSRRSWAIKAMTDDHPPVLVVPANYTTFAKGSCGQDARLTDVQSDGEQYISLTILIGDVDLLSKICGGKVELSAGYTAVMVEQPGTDAKGNKYRFIQTDIEINHLAVVDAGRAGPLARIQLDTAHPKADMSEEALKNIKYLMGAAYAVSETLTGEPDKIASVVEALGESVVALMLTGELGDEMVARLAMELELDPAVVAGMVMPGSSEGNEMENEVIEIEVADGLKVNMTKDQADAWKAHQDKVAASVDAPARTDAIAADAQAKIDEAVAAQAKLDAKIAKQDAEIAKLQADAAIVKRDALVTDVTKVCPALGAKWTADIKAGTHKMDGTAMRIAAILDLDPEAKSDIEEARGDAKEYAPHFDKFVASTFRSTVNAAVRRKTDQEESAKNQHKPPASINDAIKAKTYGVRPAPAN